MPLTLDFSNAESQRLRITQEQQKHIEELYKQASKHIGELAEQAPRVPSDVIRQQYLRDLQQQINDALRGIQRDLESTIHYHSQQVATETVKDAKEFLREVGLPIGGSYSNVPIEIVQAVASGQLYTGNWTLSRALWLNTMETQKDVQSIVAQGILENKSAYDIAKDLEKYVDPSARKDWEWSKIYPGTRKVVDYNAQRLARTMVSHAYQQAFVRTTIKNPFITKYQWQAAATERTCEICMERDGQLFDKDALPLDHPNGMCTYLAVIEDSMDKVADRLADWAHGETDPELDKWAEDLYGKGWEQKKEEVRFTGTPSSIDQFKSKWGVSVRIDSTRYSPQEYRYMLSELDKSMSWYSKNVPMFRYGPDGTVKEVVFERLTDCAGYVTGRKPNVVHLTSDYDLYNKGISNHEFTHSLIGQIMASRGVPFYDFDTRDAFCTEVRKEAFERSGLANTKANIQKYVSKYATTDNEEFIAEAMMGCYSKSERTALEQAVFEVLIQKGSK